LQPFNSRDSQKIKPTKRGREIYYARRSQQIDKIWEGEKVAVEGKGGNLGREESQQKKYAKLRMKRNLGILGLKRRSFNLHQIHLGILVKIRGAGFPPSFI
jgi:hypothetical protein